VVFVLEEFPINFFSLIAAHYLIFLSDPATDLSRPSLANNQSFVFDYSPSRQYSVNQEILYPNHIDLKFMIWRLMLDLFI